MEKVKKMIPVIGLCAAFVIGAVFASFVFGSSDKETKTITKVNAESGKEQKITIEYVSKKLENISELSAAEMVYTNLYTVEEGKIPFITKKGFSMVYKGTAKAGFDPSRLEVEVTDNEVKVILPECEILTKHVDPDSIQFYDEKKALFNKDEKTDITDAVSAAEDDLEQQAKEDGLPEKASENAEYIIKRLLEDSVDDKEIIVVRGEDL